MEGEETSGACWETQHHTRARDRSFQTACEQIKKQRGSKSRRLIEPAKIRPVSGAGSVPLLANSIVTGEQAADGSRQPGPPGRATYAVALAETFAPSQPSGPTKPTAMDSHTSENCVQMEITNRRTCTDISMPLSSMPDGTTSKAQVANACLPAGELPNKTPIFISGVIDTRSFLA